MRNKISHQIIFIILISVLFKPLWIFDNYNLGSFGEDDYSYWLHASTIAFDNDIDYLNDYYYDDKNFVDGKNTPYHPPGAGYLSSIFVKIFSLFDDKSKTDEIRINPIGSYAYLGYFFSNVLITLIALILLKKILIEKGVYRPIYIILTFLSTLVHFVSTRFLMSHSTEFFLVCAILYLFFCVEKFQKYHISLLFLTYFVLLFSRPSTFLYTILLLFIFRKKFLTISSRFSFNLTCVGLFFVFYLLLSNYLYGSYTLLFNPDINKTSQSFFENLEFSEFGFRILKIPNLFFSANMGIFFSTPVVFTAIFGLPRLLKLFENKLEKILLVIYLIAPFIILVVWGGQEVSYGQRLLVGILPICCIATSLFWNNLKRPSLLFPIAFNTYLGYLFFYSNKFLTLSKGINLWGSPSNFTAENYYINLYLSFNNLEYIVSGLTKNLYFVGFLKYINLENLKLLLIKLSISDEMVLSTIGLKTRYEEFENFYFFTYSVLVLAFSISTVYFLKAPKTID